MKHFNWYCEDTDRIWYNRRIPGFCATVYEFGAGLWGFSILRLADDEIISRNLDAWHTRKQAMKWADRALAALNAQVTA